MASTVFNGGTLRFPIRRAGKGATVPVLAPRSVVAESSVLTRREVSSLHVLEERFRGLYTRALPELEDGERLIVGVTSAVRGEGRTSTAVGLAVTIARDLEVPVLLAELDLERPMLARELRLPEQPGLTGVLEHRGDLLDALHSLPATLCTVLPAGQPPRSASRLWRGAELRNLLDMARSTYQVTVLDLPPALSSSDIVPLSNLTDGVVIAVRAGVTPTRLVDQTVACFGQGKVRGLVLNGQDSKIPLWLRRIL